MSSYTAQEQQMTQREALEVLAELYARMEDYGPIWYSEELRNRAEASLQVLRDLEPCA